MSTTSTITGALVVCVAAAGVAVGALVLQPNDDSPDAAAAAPAGAVATTAPAGGSGYGNTGGNSGGGAAPTGASAGASLDISGFQFGAVTIGPGGQVTVNNRDGAPHTVTADDGAFDSGQVGGGAASTFSAPTEAGSYDFHCDIHPEMSGTLTVG